MNLIIITSVINNSSGFFNPKDRLNQLVDKTIPSIINKIPNAKIVLLEGSILNNEQLEVLKKLPIKIFNKENTVNIDKTIGELILISSFFESDMFLTDKNVYENIIKISGRYFLLENFDFKINQNQNVIKNDHNRKVCETRYYKIYKEYINHYIDSIFSLRKINIHSDIEHLFYEKNIVPVTNDVDKIHIGGFLGPNGQYIED